MPRCTKGGCGAFFASQQEYLEHLKTHRRPIRRPEPEIHRCENCGRIIPTPFSHWNRCN